ncbi:hypothetical protein PSN45_000501 [Yamadazyma tenuis]|uniref:Uncharacterized protein n=1 Tax=Candida tenuis (strain ATCC 10573 / BCRC 21748 / CBS 615 / JCM 9827 / NBRC 10315 / NRRL Y-1498 / VKM Y-70) TaxID=590646 RepID=G3B8Z7_CANTC|nr:uncharacterized protein CANTEDRAFT_94695 [Yamadazyma tenuis ATCC 10573]EGV61815.1 hypothetical protein CANTEDRAFT_94695 [Yamadazyma tenuis ATCC 10573]WEJ93041.1 hypothetical protein PSN45_000501 [Yamadazyma tenuis]
MDSEEVVDNFVHKCWDTVSKGKDYIYVLQLRELISELELQLNGQNFLKHDETKLLNEMIQDKPTLKLYKSELKNFVLKLVKHTSLLRFLTERTGISRANLVSLITNPSKSYPLSPNQTVNHMSRPFMKRGLGSFKSMNMQENQVNQREDHISLISRENSDLQSSNKEHQFRIRSLEKQNQSLKDYIETLEKEARSTSIVTSTKGNKSQDSVTRDLINQCNQRDKTIKVLESMCEQYQKEFEKLKENSVIKNLTANLEQQNQLIDSLQSKLRLQSDNHSEELQQFLFKIPLLKQYRMYYRYKEQHKNVGIVFVNVVTLIITCIIIMTILRIFYFITLNVFNNHNSGAEYIYDTYGINHWGDEYPVSMVWWKEFQWLEYLAYQMGDWFETR